jgi:hypothetical protein
MEPYRHRMFHRIHGRFDLRRDLALQRGHRYPNR